MKKEKNKEVIIHFTPRQFKQLKDCFMIIQDFLSIAEIINESALGLLVDLDERKEIERFVEGFLKTINKDKR